MFWRIIICFIILWSIFTFIVSFTEYTFINKKSTLYILTYKERLIGSLIFSIFSIIFFPISPILIGFYVFNKIKRFILLIV